MLFENLSQDAIPGNILHRQFDHSLTGSGMNRYPEIPDFSKNMKQFHEFSVLKFKRYGASVTGFFPFEKFGRLPFRDIACVSAHRNYQHDDEIKHNTSHVSLSMYSNYRWH
jgi:hypothetical protein